MTLLIEFSPTMLRLAGSDPDELLALLNERFVVEVMQGGEPLVRSTDVTSLYVDLVCSPLDLT
jgi:hypothetical protein